MKQIVDVNHLIGPSYSLENDSGNDKSHRQENPFVPMGSAIMHQVKRLHNLMLSSLFMTKVRFHFIEQESILA
ncbi:hypothetical protein ABEW61_19920 [Paenibacillus amylolyticus]|uniref:hypothetical protein n=1 Tax=Paenibacillus amylolyticus TaxID=1451 RepID=UPI003D2C50C8